jgi:hypothetical protein
MPGRRSRLATPAPLRDDITAFLAVSFAQLENDDRMRALLPRIIAAAQHDEHVAATLGEFTAARRATLRKLLEHGQARGELSSAADLAMLTDMAYGVLWYRVLVGHAPLDAAAAESLARCLLAAGA